MPTTSSNMPPKKADTVGQMSKEELLELFSNVLQPLKDSVNKLQETVQDLQNELAIKDERINKLETIVNEGLDEREQYSRRNNIRVFGIQESESEDTDQIVLDLAAKLGVPLVKQQIDRSHRVGRMGPKPRPIIVKLVSYAQRRALFMAKKSLKGTGTFVCEDLTKTRRELLKKIVEAFSKEKVWTIDGTILVNVGKSRPFRVRFESDFVKLMNNHPPV